MLGPDFAQSHTRLTGRVVESATDSHLTGFALTCGASSPAAIAERLSLHFLKVSSDLKNVPDSVPDSEKGFGLVSGTKKDFYPLNETQSA